MGLTKQRLSLIKLMIAQVVEDERWRRDLDDETTGLLIDWASRRIKETLAAGTSDEEQSIHKAYQFRMALACLAHLTCHGAQLTIEARLRTWQELSTSLTAAIGYVPRAAPALAFERDDWWKGTPVALASRLLAMIDSPAGRRER